MSLVDKIENKIKDKVNGVIGDVKFKFKAKHDTIENLKVIKGGGSGVNFDATLESPIELLQDIGLENYETILKMNNFVNSTLGKYGKMVGIDPNNKFIQGATNIVGGIDTVMGYAGKVIDLFSGQSFKRNLGTAPPSSLDKTFGKEDPISKNVNIRTRIHNIAERCGYAMDKSLSIGYSRNYIFTSRPTLASDESGKYKSFVYILRPNANLVNKNDGGLYRLAPELKNYNSLYHLVASDPKLFSELCRDGCAQSNLFRLLSNYVKEVPPVRLAETERSGVENMYGYSTPVAGVPEYHNVDVSVTFNDNYRGDIAKLLYCISEYRHNVSKRGYPMRPEYIQNNADDTLISMYVITTTADMEVIGFGVFLNGVISDTPSHFTQFRQEGFSKDELLDNFTVNIKFSTYYPHSPMYYDHFNSIMDFNPLDVVDVRGTEYNLVAPGRHIDTESSGSVTRAPLFGIDFGLAIDTGLSSINGIINKGQEYVEMASGYIDKATSLLHYGGNPYNMVKNFIDKGKVDVNSTIVESVGYRYKGQFEFFAKKPGIYAASSQNPLEQGRVIYRLGFSY